MEQHLGKVAVITGAAQGLGQSHARQLAQDGADVVSVDLAPADETRALVEAAGRRFLACRCDVADAAAVARLGDEVAAFGGCDILVNNAGIYPLRLFDDTDFGTWQDVMRVNLDSLYLVSRAFLPGMRDRGWGRIINTTSASVHMNAPGFVAYMTSKMGIIGFTRALASEVADAGIRVNAVGPSLVRTPTTEDPATPSPFHLDPDAQFSMLASLQSIHREQVPSDVSGTVSFLASEAAEFITGQVIYVDGGIARAA